MKHINLLYILLLSMCSLFGCKSNSSTPSTEPTGNLSGDVILYDQNCNTLTDNSGVKVDIEGTAFSAVTNSKGSWTISGLPAGSYSIAFSKSGYDTTKFGNYHFVVGGAGYFDKINFYQVPAFSPILTSIRLADSLIKGTDTTIVAARSGISGTFTNISWINKQLEGIVYFSTDPLVSPNNITSVVYSIAISASPNSPDFFERTPAFDLYSRGFKSGDKVYAVAYSSGCNISSYLDAKSGKYIHTGYGKIASNVISSILP